MKSSTSLREIQEVASLGVQFQYSKELGKNLFLSDLLDQYDAVFLGLGLGADRFLEEAPLDHPRVLGAVEWIAQIKSSPTKNLSCHSGLSWMTNVKTVLVIGGGNTALDACRELKGLGVPRVCVSYRRSDAEMSGYRHERNHARNEGVEFHFNTRAHLIKPISDTELEVSLSHSQKTIQEMNQEVNQEMTSATQSLRANLVLLAVGQAKLESLINNIPGLIFENGKLQADPKTGLTGHPKIYAGGDLVNGGMEVVNAVSEGKRAALGIDKALTRKEL